MVVKKQRLEQNRIFKEIMTQNFPESMDDSEQRHFNVFQDFK